jgi:hypothetical protein
LADSKRHFIGQPIEPIFADSGAEKNDFYGRKSCERALPDFCVKQQQKKKKFFPGKNFWERGAFSFLNWVGIGET